MNKRQATIYRNYKNSFKRTLYDCYERYSRNKIHAYDRCMETMYDYKGYDLRIISHNSHIFTVGFRYENDCGTECLMYITPTKRESFKIEEVE